MREEVPRSLCHIDQRGAREGVKQSNIAYAESETRFVGSPELRSILSIGRTTFYRLMAAGLPTIGLDKGLNGKRRISFKIGRHFRISRHDLPSAYTSDSSP